MYLFIYQESERRLEVSNVNSLFFKGTVLQKVHEMGTVH
jgi:hypothetical protein